MAESSVPKSRNVNMTEGPLWNRILIYFIPLLLTTVFQRLLHAMDVAVIGSFAGELELAAVGAAGPISSVITNLIGGLSTGATVVVGQLVGSKKDKTAKKAIHNSVLIGLVGGMVIAVLGVIFTRPLLIITSTPDEILNLSAVYLTIIFISKPFSLAAAFAAESARSKGDSKGPLVCTTLSGLTNLILNVIFVAAFNMGVFGVAIATFISEVVFCVTMLISLSTDKSQYQFKLGELKPDKFILYKIIIIGMPSALQSILLPFSSILIQSSYNLLGTTVVAASAAASTWETMSFCVTAAFTSTAIAFVSQNYGAGKLSRCTRTLFITIAFSTVFTYIIDFFIIYFNTYTVGMISKDPQVIELATQRLMYVFAGHFFLIVADQLTSALRGFGKSMHSSIVYVSGVCVLRCIWILTVFKYYKTYASIILVYPVTFIITAVAMTFVFIYIYIRLPIRNEK